jgi:hypothetical protein
MAASLNKMFIMRRIVFIIFCLGLFGCKAALLKRYQITDPKKENSESINRYLQAKGLDKGNDFVFKDILSFAKASEKKYLSIPDAIFYNRKGYYVNYSKTSSQCNAGVDDFITDLENFSNYEYDDSKHIDELNELIVGSQEPNPQDADITIFITWTIYSGKLNDEKAFLWLKLLDEAKLRGVNLNYYILNCDLQNNWDFSNVEISSN